MIHLIKDRLQPKATIELPCGFYTFLNPWSYLLMRKNLESLKSMDGLFFDGFILVKLFKLIGIETERCSFDFTSLAPLLFKKLELNQSPIGFIGSENDSLNNSIKTFQREFPHLNIVYSRNGYFKEDELANTFSYLKERTDIKYLVVGMGTPHQEIFLSKLKLLQWPGTAFTCGGFLHQSAGNIQYYPHWIDKLNLRAFYRMWDEPKLIKRYFLGYPTFLIVFTFDIFKYFLSSLKAK